MRKHRTWRGVGATALLAALALLALASSASAKLTGEFTRFQFCPYTEAGVERCIYAVTTGGKVVLGSKEVPIEKEVVLQGGYAEIEEEEAEKGVQFVPLHAATNGITLSKAKQNVPGGLAGIVPKESSSPLVKALVKFFFENSLTGLTSTLELAKSASDVKISEAHLASGVGVALILPVKIHLENPFLGKSCYVGSSGSPITWNLTVGKTSPPLPNESITGNPGKIEFLEKARILKLSGAELVDNAWSAPGASGCGGIISFLVNPIINTQLGNTTAGHNTAKLANTIYETTSFGLKKNNEENP